MPLLKLLRKLPVKIDIDDIATFINRELIPFLQEIRDSFGTGLEQIPTDSLLGRDTAGTGDVENITLDDTLEFTGTGQIQRSEITGDVEIPAGSNVSEIPALDEEFIVASASASLPGARVATDSDTIDVDNSTPGITKWNKILPTLRIVAFNASSVLDVSTFSHEDSVLLNTPSDVAVTLQGMTAKTEGFRLYIFISGAANDGRVIVSHEDAAATATERFRTPYNGDFYIPEDGGLIVTYSDSGAGGRWRTHAANGINIRENGTSRGTRPSINFLDTTSIPLTVTEDTANDEIEVSAQRAALTGAITAALNTNATLFGGIRDNGSAENDRTNLNYLTGTKITSVITDDAGNDELEIVHNWDGIEIWTSAGVDQGDFVILQFADTTSIITDGGSFAGPRWQQRFQRAALSGAVGAAQNVNTTTFDGIKNNGSATANRTNLNFLNSSTLTLSVVDDAGNDELEISGTVTVTGRHLLTTVYSTAGSGTHTYNAAATSADVYVWGSGGGGGGVDSAVTGRAGAGGGGSGGFFRLRITSLPASSDYVVGAGGAGGAVTPTAGTNGGNSTFNDGSGVITANGGTGGSLDTNGVAISVSAGGTGGNSPVLAGNIIVASDGSSGHCGIVLDATHAIGGQGGNGPYGGGGEEDVTTTGGNSATGPAAGGGGASSSSTSRTGGGGFDGLIIVVEYS